MPKRDPLKELYEKHGYDKLTRTQKARIRADYAPSLAVMEDFAAYWIGKRKQKTFDTYSRLRNWLRINKNGHRRLSKPEPQQPEVGFEVDELMERYR